MPLIEKLMQKITLVNTEKSKFEFREVKTKSTFWDFSTIKNLMQGSKSTVFRSNRSLQTFAF